MQVRVIIGISDILCYNRTCEAGDEPANSLILRLNIRIKQGLTITIILSLIHCTNSCTVRGRAVEDLCRELYDLIVIYRQPCRLYVKDDHYGL